MSGGDACVALGGAQPLVCGRTRDNHVLAPAKVLLYRLLVRASESQAVQSREQAAPSATSNFHPSLKEQDFLQAHSHLVATKVGYLTNRNLLAQGAHRAPLHERVLHPTKLRVAP